METEWDPMSTLRREKSQCTVGATVSQESLEAEEVRELGAGP